MNWVKDRKFQLVNRNGRRYVYRRNNTGNTEINVPATVRTKAQAQQWLMDHPERVKKPNRHRPRAGGKRSALGVGPMFLEEPVWQRSPNVKWDCALKTRLFKVVTNNGRTGFKATKPMNGAKLATEPNSKLKITPGIARIGKGRAGIVYLASTSSRRHKYVAIKIIPHDKAAEARKDPQPAVVEYTIQKQIQGVDDWVRAHVVNVFNLVHCMDFVDPREINVNNANVMNTSKQSVIFMQYANGGSLLDWMSKMSRTRKLNDAFMVVVISQVLRTLYRIMKKYPDFRHNDLHIENLFVQDGHAHLKWPVILIGDFGWARTKKMGTNPAVNTARPNGVTTGAYGVGPDTDARYDAHLFLNELHAWCLKHKAEASDGFAKTISFLERILPQGYRGETNTHVSKWRLKYEDPCPGLPKLSEILRDKFLKRNSNDPLNVGWKYYINNINRPSPPKPKAPSPTRPKPRTPSPKKKWTNAELQTISATNFARLSPATRARALALRKNRPKKTPSPPKVQKTSPPKKAKTPPKKVVHKPLPKGVLKTAKFDRLVNKLWREAGAKANANYQNAWNNARRRAINIIQARVNANKSPFSPSPARKTKTPSPPKAPRKTPSPPKAPRKTPSPPKAPRKTPSSPKVLNNFTISPSSKRIKIRAPNSGRMVYANGPTITLTYLKNLATRRGVNIKGLRSKNSIARKIFGR
jgi:Protein kinase domain